MPPYLGVPAAIVIALALIPWRERVSPISAELIPGGRMPVRATVGGLLEEVRAEEGAPVSRGDVLAVLRDDEVRIRISETEGALASARREEASARARGDETRSRLAGKTRQSVAEDDEGKAACHTDYVDDAEAARRVQAVGTTKGDAD